MLWIRCALLTSWLLFSSPAADEWPTEKWMEATPESQGVDSRALGDAVSAILEKKLPVHSLLVVRHGAIVLDANFYPYSPGTLHDVASVTKSVTSILVGMAIDRGYLGGVTDPALPLLKRPLPSDMDDRKRKITIESLLTMTSGFDCGAVGVAHTTEAELAEMRHQPDWIAYALNLPMRFEPNTRFAYCSVNNHLLPAIFTAQTGKKLSEFAREELFRPLGIKQYLWPEDPSGLTFGWGDLHLVSRDMAKIGLLYLRGGKWEERQVVSKQWVRASFEPHTTMRPGVGYGYSWWINLERNPHIPEAEGRGGQRISVLPDKDVVVVFTSGGADTDVVAGHLLRALESDSPLPPNPEACARLQGILRAARMAPEPAPPAPLPRLAREISGRTFRFGPNLADVHSASLSFGPPDHGAMVLQVGNETWKGDVGLDGLYRFSPMGRNGITLGTRGNWRSETDFLLDVDLIGDISHLQFEFHFTGADRAVVDLKDTTGSIPDMKLTAFAESARSSAVGGK
jgi:CubicO group peptidase (beta-lactamase class C family)